MIHLLKIDPSGLPTPRELTFREHAAGGVCLVVDLPTIVDARVWAQALGVTLKDTDPDCQFIHVRQEAGAIDRGPLHVVVIGTEKTPDNEKDARRVIQAATRATREAVAS